jgi:S-DNA-T family DNA segregation ATPase FtsK/SpoIIIE
MKRLDGEGGEAMASRSTTRSPAPRKRPPARAKAVRRPAKKKAPGIHLEQRHYDLIGMGLVALAVFFAFVIWLGWDGGRIGDGAVDGLRWLVGEVHHVAPVVCLLVGALLVMRPALPSVGPIKTGGACLFFASTIWLARGPELPEDAGGNVGKGLHWILSTGLGAIGADIVAVFLFVAALLLLTGATIAGVVKATSDSVTTSGRRVKAGATTVGRAVPRRRPVTEELEALERRPGRVRATSRTLPEREHALPDVLGEAEEIFAGAVPELERLADDPEVEEEGVHVAEAPTQLDLTPQGRLRASVTDSPEFAWKLPHTEFLKRSSDEAMRPDTAGQEKTAAALVEALGHFGVEAKIIGMVAGPHITRYELRLAPGTKVAKVAQLKDDLAYALAASDIRVLAPIPGKQAVGVEVPNLRRKIVHLGDVLSAVPEGWSPLTVWLGKDVAGRAIGADLAKMPHLLVAGTTGAGKSGAVNAMLSSILLNATPHEVRMVLVDPKQVELNHYESIPHLLTPVITSPRKAATALQNLVREMEQRYSHMSLARTRSLVELNKVRASRGEAPLPYILCVIDELADLMMVAPADVEDSIIRIAQKARAVGIHLVLATQSPRVDVITGMIKANVPSRIAFAVSSQTDSRVILDQNGAESLLGQGDMLFSAVGSSRLQRIQGAYIDEDEILGLTDAWRAQGEPEFKEELLEEVAEEAVEGAQDTDFDPDDDPLLEDAIRLVAEMQTASTSMLQRRLRLGYTRAGRLIDMLERRGVISGYEGSKPRQVLISEADVPRVVANLAEAGRMGAAGVRAVLEELPEALPEPE